SGLAAAGALGWLPGAPARQIQLIVMLVMEGWIGLAIMALLHKIIPFLIWISRAGQSRAATPALARDLFAERLSRLTMGAHLLGAGLSCGGVAAGLAGMIRAGSGLIALAGLGLLANSWRAWQAHPATPRRKEAQPAGGLARPD
ncbi:MAG TPA: hypothetical protein VD886_06245, partial [Herpetosiphonaceae bacterium]|nr:hypothetical protein [Herpetosiphonaceae bacterium]